MKKLLLVSFIFAILVSYASSFQIGKIYAAQLPKENTVLLADLAGPTPPPADGTWLPDSETTFAGKNAARSKDLFNWTLVNYKWAYQDNPLVNFWVEIRNIVFAFLILLVLIAAFSMIVTGGQSLKSVVFVRKFIFVVLLIAFSFAMLRFLYQINDVIIGFFVRNPDGNVISSKDLLNISFDYVSFSGYRRYGMQYDEAAFVSLLLVKITAFTYYVMAAILIIRKVILWFFITVSPIYPLLLFYYPIRNTAKIWIGEFFRWLLYAPLFTIFLNALVQLWRSDINILPFQFSKTIVYPTAVNILLGGPGQTLAIDNNINNNDSFAQYVVALIMVWVVILLPFLLLKIFLDYLSNININKDTALSYINNARNYIANRDLFNNNKPSSPSPTKPPSGYQPTGAARSIPFITTGAAKQIPQGAANQSTSTYTSNPITTTTSTTQTTTNYATRNTMMSNRAITSIPKLKTEQLSAQTMQLLNFPIPTMRDVARFETQKLTSEKSSVTQLSQMKDTLQKIANPYTITNTNERQQFSQIRERLFQQKVKGDSLASSILNAANNINNVSTSITSSVSSASQSTQINTQKILNETLQKLANPTSITNTIERQQFNQIKETLVKEQQQGNPVATNVLSTINAMTTNTSQSVVNTPAMQQTLEKLANTEKISDVKEKEQYTKIKDELEQQSKNGNPLATSLLHAAEAKKPTTGAISTTNVLPQQNQVQTVNLDDYEDVKKMWTDNYKNVEVPKSLEKPNRSRNEWINDDLSEIKDTVGLLTSNDNQLVNKGMEKVSSLLPFLLIGGFSQTEVVAYLKAKQKAAEEVIEELKSSKEQDETELTKQTVHKKHATMVQHQSIDIDNNSTSDELSEEESPLSQVKTTAVNLRPELLNTKTLSLINFSIPSMNDVAKYEAAHMSSSNQTLSQQLEQARQHIDQVYEILHKIADPATIKDTTEREKYEQIRKTIQEEVHEGNPLATSIMEAATNLAITKGQTEQLNQITVPQQNQVQTVNLDDYEDVKKLWIDNYKNIDTPQSPDKPVKSREEWIKEDTAHIDSAINMLTSHDENKIKEGMNLVSNILPFLLIGGFSLTEIIAYLKAKRNAGEEVLSSLNRDEQDDSFVENKKKEEEKHLENELPDESINPSQETGPQELDNSKEDK